MPHKFKLGDIVRCTPEGHQKEAYGHRFDKLTVVELCTDTHMGGAVIRVRPTDGRDGFYGGRWREMWYELVEPEACPW